MFLTKNNIAPCFGVNKETTSSPSLFVDYSKRVLLMTFEMETETVASPAERN